ncbi:MAG TPA: hypothetical protein VJM50_18145 [Pyrinomonadaceae bacterium]|nr:hypothetical protein [Pyrinomonadaceae bacterium]
MEPELVTEAVQADVPAALAGQPPVRPTPDPLGVVPLVIALVAAVPLSAPCAPALVDPVDHG